MDFIKAGIIFFLTWWLVLFLVLPWKNKSDKKTDLWAKKVGAPQTPHLLLKFVIVTVISLVLSVIIYVFIAAA